jgi:streptogramin lyase
MKPRSTTVSLLLVALLVVSCSGPGLGSQRPGNPAGPPGSAPQASADLPSSPPSNPAQTPLPAGVLASIAVLHGDAPGGLAVGFGSVWVESHRGTHLYRIDPDSDRVIAQIDLGQEACGVPGIGFGRVWVPPCSDGTRTSVIDPETNQVVGSYQGGIIETVFVDGSVWTSTPTTIDGTFMRIDPTSLQPTATTHVGRWPVLAVEGDGFIWVADGDPLDPSRGSISKVDPATGLAVATFSTPTPGTYAMLRFAFGALWFKGSDNPRLLRIDPVSGNVTTYMIAGYTGMSQFFDANPVDGLGSLWVRIADGTVARIDPATGTVTGTYPADPAGGGGEVAVAFGSLWVANFATDTIWRVRIQG